MFERGNPSERRVMWPGWRQEPAGTRVRHVRTGRTGTFVRPAPNRHNGAIIDWDDTGFGIQRGNVVSPAYDLEQI